MKNLKEIMSASKGMSFKVEIHDKIHLNSLKILL